MLTIFIGKLFRHDNYGCMRGVVGYRRDVYWRLHCINLFSSLVSVFCDVSFSINSKEKV